MFRTPLVILKWLKRTFGILFLIKNKMPIGQANLNRLNIVIYIQNLNLQLHQHVWSKLRYYWKGQHY